MPMPIPRLATHRDGNAAPRSRRAWIALALVVAAGGVLVLHAWAYFPFFWDDAFISLRYAERLLAGDGLTWTDGERVEGYSNLLWVLCVAALGAVGVDLIVAARALGLCGTIVALAAIVWAMRTARWRETPPALVGALALASSGAIAAWAIGGLENGLLSGLVAWAIAIVLRPIGERAIRGDQRDEPALAAYAGGRNANGAPHDVPAARNELGHSSAWLAGALLALASLTRIDGILLAIGIAIGVLIAHNDRRRALAAAARILALPIALVAAQAVFRLVYYDDWLPNAARIKVAWSLDRPRDGLEYVAGCAWTHLPLLALALVAALLPDRASRRALALLIPPGLLWLAHVVVTGGDPFPAYRRMGPLLIFVAFAVAHATRRLSERARPGALVAAVAAAGLLGSQWQMQRSDPQIRLATTEHWVWDGQVVGEFLREAFGPRQPLLACDPAGCLPYFSRLPSLDMLGLNDRHIAQHPPPPAERTRLGHDFGDGAYVLRRRPDIILFYAPGGQVRAQFRGGREMQAMPEFHDLYRLVHFEPRRPYTVLTRAWVRIDSERIGVRREPDRVVIPAYLAASSEDATAQLVPAGGLALLLYRPASACVTRVTVSPGIWSVSVRGDGPVELSVRDAGSGAMLATGERPALQVEGEPKAIDIELSATARDPVRVTEILLERMP